MALAIANIPVLEGDEAEAFVRMANENLKKRGTVKLRYNADDIREMDEKSRRFMEIHHLID